MNYLKKNFKTLRVNNGLSQNQFGRLFGLSKENVKSYESGTVPKIEKYFQIMQHYGLDPVMFLERDMETHSVLIGPNDAQDRNKVLSSWVSDDVSKNARFEHLNNLSSDEIIELYLSLVESKELLLKENLELKDKYLKLVERFDEFLAKK